MERPILGLTLGDVAGVGPEVVISALAKKEVYDWCRPVVLGDMGALRQAIDLLGFELQVSPIDIEAEPQGLPEVVEVWPLSQLYPDELVYGRPTSAGGRAAAVYIETGARLALDGQIQGLVTAPISKEALNKAGYKYPGHTEMLAALAGGPEVVMMLAGERLKVVLVTIHEAILNVPHLITVEKILTVAEITHRSLTRFFGLARPPRLAAAALNPHAGEGGLFGREEETVIAPAVAQAQALGINLTGPYPPDTLFYRAVNGEFDAVVCMYHDQGLIPFKLLHFKDGVNVTLGLPFIRTSVDHGTAYDLAGKGQADPSSLLAAIKMAASMAGRI